MSLIAGLLMTAFLFFFLEIFLPGGILGLMGGTLILLAAVLTYLESGLGPAVAVGLSGFIAAAILFLIEVKFLGSSRMGRFIRLDQTLDATVASKESDELIGKEGVTLTTLNPQGKVRIEDQSYTAFAIEGYLPKGTAVITLRIEPYKIIVKKK